MKWQPIIENPKDDKEKNIRYLIGKEWVRDTGYFQNNIWFDSKTDQPFPKAFLNSSQQFEWLDETQLPPASIEGDSCLEVLSELVELKSIKDALDAHKGVQDQDYVNKYADYTVRKIKAWKRGKEIVLTKNQFIQPSIEGRSKDEILRPLLLELGYDYDNIKSTAGLSHYMLEIAEQAMEIYKNQP